jgi:hypothetical protein
MKKKILIFGLFAVLASSAYAVEVVENTCKLSFNFFGIVKKWSGYKLVETYDIYGKPNGTREIGCGENEGSWDWFWE